jgi:hypothetical protein
VTILEDHFRGQEVREGGHARAFGEMLAESFRERLDPCDELADARAEDGRLAVPETAGLEGRLHGRQQIEVAIRETVN